MAHCNLRRSKRSSTKNKSRSPAHAQAASSPLKSTIEEQDPITLKSLWKAIKQMKSDLFQHIDKKTADIQIKLTTIQGSLSTLAEQVAEVENRVSTNEDNLQDAADRITQLEKEMSSLKTKPKIWRTEAEDQTFA
ncbi:hypothetical protein EOD39_14464 [Acipenser ruthenus]|uniref:Uncharacterized protein n=1 Tax=Acipenser ruthenus TaxID=7906 RepID=A0A662YLT3_ACIRT|nr:hypothetical protein EOD39_14464 [Acipenser ruthenus]